MLNILLTRFLAICVFSLEKYSLALLSDAHKSLLTVRRGARDEARTDYVYDETFSTCDISLVPLCSSFKSICFCVLEI